MEIKIIIDAPGLEKAITLLAAALNGAGIPVAKVDPPTATTGVGATKETKNEDMPEKDTTKEAAKTEKTVSGITFQAVKDKLMGFSRAGRQAEMKELITSFGAVKLSDIPEDKYAELIEKADEIL